MSPFIHLRARSAYSLLQSAIQVKALTKLAAKQGMPALGLADSNNLFGALEFSEAAFEAGLQPIVGLALELRGDEHVGGMLALYAQNAAGYANLMRLSSAAYLEADSHEEPHVTFERVLEHAVWGMLPKSRMGRRLIRRLKVYAGDTHPHDAQQPKKMELA